MNEPIIQTALVTGGATGIGAAITARLAADGMNVFVVQRSESEVKEGQKTFQGNPAAERIQLAAHDLSTSQGCTSAVSGCIERFPGVHVLVNNAAVSGEAAVGALSTYDDAQIDRIIDTNLKAPLRLAREALPHLAASRGVIVNISSVAEFLAQPEASAYVASKAGLGGLTRALALDLAADGVRVVCIAAGDIETATSRSAELIAQRRHIKLGKQVPLGYAGKPKDIANAVAWVISDHAGYVSGSTIVVDGGLSAY